MDDLYSQIIAVYPELAEGDYFYRGIITLQDDSDGKGQYIAAWNYEKPIPKGLKLGK